VPTYGYQERRPRYVLAEDPKNHPVYSIEVREFKTLATCRFDREDVWTPLADWLLIE
jgi:hypothetical protein